MNLLKHPQPTADATRGSSLLELLVVLAIIAVLTGALTLAVGSSGAGALENAARRTEALVSLACERAQYTGVPMGFGVVERRLAFGPLGNGPWERISESSNDELRDRALPDGVELRQIADDSAASERVDAEIAEIKPEFACFESGELTPFEFEFSRAGVATRWSLRGELDGRLSLTAIAESGASNAR